VKLATHGNAGSRNRIRQWYHNSSLAAGGAILAVLVGAAAAAPLIAPYGPLKQNLNEILLPPTPQHWLGTDNLGRDVWSRLLYAARTDLRVGIFAVLAPFSVGSLFGSLAGYYGGWIDAAVTGAGNLVMAFPYYVLIISLVFILGAGINSIYLALAFVAWVSYARIIRGEVLRVKGFEYVLAARVAGFSSFRILLRHILPNVITQGIVFAMGDIVVIIVGVVTLSYLGLGVPPPTPDWGSMISEGQTFITTRWQLATFPGLAVVVTGVALSLLGDGLAGALKPE
jgi:peptide/nickel transport system permease protein